MEIHKPILYGSLSGGIGYFSTLPFDYIKQHLQTKHKPSYIIQLIKEHGIKSMFRGGLIGLYSIVPQMAIKFTTFDILQKYDKHQNEKNTPVTPKHIGLYTSNFPTQIEGTHKIETRVLNTYIPTSKYCEDDNTPINDVSPLENEDR